MADYGKKITIFLVDGDPDGRQTGEISNWSGKAIRIPRNMLKDSFDRPELESAGVYLLPGKNPEDPDRDMVYIGEAENLGDRIKQHLKDEKKEFFRDFIGIISKDENLNKAHIKYLEGRMVQLASEMGRFELANSQTPAKTKISEPEMAEMEEFLFNIRILINTLGFRIFEPRGGQILKAEESTEDLLYIENTKGVRAIGRPVPEGFQVFEGSIASTTTTASVQAWTEKIRNQIIHSGRLVKEGEEMVFKENVIFTSPSTAAAVVLGRSANGLTEWKTKEGKVLKSLESGE